MVVPTPLASPGPADRPDVAPLILKRAAPGDMPKRRAPQSAKAMDRRPDGELNLDGGVRLLPRCGRAALSGFVPTVAPDAGLPYRFGWLTACMLALAHA